MAENGLKKCDHKRLEVKGIHDNPNPDPNSLYISDPSLACLDCGMNVFNVPDDVSKIVNIHHYPEAECSHKDEIYTLQRKHHCLNCGRVISKPVVKLEITRNDIGGVIDDKAISIS